MKKRFDFTPEFIEQLHDDEVFVFGSNIEGDHNGGAALVALRNFGAKPGIGEGFRGRSYAIPTIQGKRPEYVKPYVDRFLAFAKSHPELFFYVTRIGCGNAGFSAADIAPLFREAVTMPNVCLPRDFVECLSPN